MALHEYQVVINGVTTTMQLSEADAERVGVNGSTDTGDSGGQVPNKARGTTLGTSTSRKRKAREGHDDDSAGES